jgi:hypothetical protein
MVPNVVVYFGSGLKYSSLYNFKIFGFVDLAKSEYCPYGVVKTFLSTFLSSCFKIT